MQQAKHDIHEQFNSYIKSMTYRREHAQSTSLHFGMVYRTFLVRPTQNILIGRVRLGFKPCNILISRKFFYLSTRCKTSKTILSKIPLLSVLMCQLTKNGHQRTVLSITLRMIKRPICNCWYGRLFPCGTGPIDSQLLILATFPLCICIVHLVPFEKLFPGHSTKTTELLFPCGKKKTNLPINTPSVMTKM